MFKSSRLAKKLFNCISNGKVEKTQWITNIIGDTETNKKQLIMSVGFSKNSFNKDKSPFINNNMGTITNDKILREKDFLVL